MFLGILNTFNMKVIIIEMKTVVGTIKFLKAMTEGSIPRSGANFCLKKREKVKSPIKKTLTNRIGGMNDFVFFFELNDSKPNAARDDKENNKRKIILDGCIFDTKGNLKS